MLRMMNHHTVCTLSILYACSWLSYFLSQEYPWNSLKCIWDTCISDNVTFLLYTGTLIYTDPLDLCKCIPVFKNPAHTTHAAHRQFQEMSAFTILTFSLWLTDPEICTSVAVSCESVVWCRQLQWCFSCEACVESSVLKKEPKHRPPRGSALSQTRTICAAGTRHQNIQIR